MSVASLASILGEIRGNPPAHLPPEISRKVVLVLLSLLSLPCLHLHWLMLVRTDTKQSEFESNIAPSEGAVSHSSLFSSSQTSCTTCRQCGCWRQCQKSLGSLICKTDAV